MNEIVNKFSLTGEMFVPEMQLRKPSFSYSSPGSFLKNKKE